MSLHLHDTLGNLHAIAKRETDKWVVQVVYIEDDPTGKSLPFTEVLQTFQAPVDISVSVLKAAMSEILADVMADLTSPKKSKSKKSKR